MAIAEGIKYWSDNEAVRGFDANAFLMSQSVMRFESASDRDVALAQSLTEGMVAYDKSTNSLQLYDGSVWQGLAFGSNYLPLTGGTLTGSLTGTDITATNFYVSGDDGLTAVTGDYGSVETFGSGANGWEGYSINGWVVFMANSSTGNFGIYDDVNNHWALYCDFNGFTSLRFAGAEKLITQSTGVGVTGTVTATAFSGDGSSVTSLNASNLSSGTVPDARISGNYSGIGILTLTDEIRVPDGTSADPSYAFSSDSNTGIFLPGLDRLGITAGGVAAEFRTDGLHLASGDWYRVYGDGCGIYWNDSTLGWRVDADDAWIRIHNGSRLKGFYSNGGRVAAFQATSGQTDTQRRDWEWSQGRFEADADNGISVRNINDSGTVQFRPSAGTLYVRNHNDTAYYPIIGGSYTNGSSITTKENVQTWETPKDAGAAVGPEAVVDAVSKVRALRPVTYRMKREQILSVSPQDPRRKAALLKLNDMRTRKGLDLFVSDETLHQCGRDCAGSVSDPCIAMRNWEKGNLGLISEEVAEVEPLVVTDTNDGPAMGVDTYALCTLLVKALQEIDARLSTLETRQ